MIICLNEDNFNAKNQYFSFECAVFVAFRLEKHNFLRISLVFDSEFEAFFAWLPYINDLLKAFPIGKHYL